MSWLKIDDGFSMHTKARLAGKDGRALWHVAAEGCARENLEGVVPAHMLQMYAAVAEVPARKAAKLLVSSGLWHPADDLCPKCVDRRDEHATRLENEGRELAPLRPGDHYFHDWTDYQLDKEGKDDPIARKRAERKRKLYRTEAGKAIIAAVRERDQDRCRYCGQPTIWSVGRGGDTKSLLSGTIDHLDPLNWVNSPENCVVACRQHNGQKGARTPEAWEAAGGLALLPPPKPYQPRNSDGSKADQSPAFDPDQNGQSPDQGVPSRGAQGGPGLWSDGSPAADPALTDRDLTEGEAGAPDAETPETGDDPR